MAQTQPDFSGNPYFTRGYFPPRPNLNPTLVGGPVTGSAAAPYQSALATQQDAYYTSQPAQEQVGGGQERMESGKGGSWLQPQVAQPDAGARTRFGPRAFNAQPAMRTMPIQPVSYQNFGSLLGSIPQRTRPQPRSQGFTQNWMAGRRSPDRAESASRQVETGA